MGSLAAPAPAPIRPDGTSTRPFMDALAAEGFVMLGGPVGEGDGENVLLIVDGNSEATIRARLADDPWSQDMLIVESLEPWSVWLRASEDWVRPGG